jgi:hypothetical protein
MLTLLTGRYDALEPQALSGLLVIEVVFRVERGFLVAAAVLDETLARGLYLLDPSTGEHTVVIPPELADAAWAPGADATTTLRSTSISPPGQVPAYWTTVRTIGGHFVYGRLMIDGSTMLFARPSSLEPARELALFRLDPTTAWLELRDPFPDRPLTGSTLGAAPVQPVTSHAAWSREVGGGMSILTVWDDRGERLVSCPVPQGLGVLTGALMSSRRKLAFGPAAAFSGDPIPTSLTLVAPDAAAAGDVAGACRVLAAGGVVSSQTSPDGETLVWLVAGDGAERELWTATGDGAPRKLGAGMIDQPYFSGAAQVHFRLGTDLVWLDPHDDPVRLHYVAEKVFGFPSGGGGSWFIAGYGFSEQDSTGTLGLVRWGDGAKRPVSGAVAAYRVLEPVAPFTVVYLVRGRTPSPQAGFWVATLTADDLR